MSDEEQDPKDYKGLGDIPEDERREAFNMFFSPEGFFQLFMHESRGPRELIGFLEQAKDVVKQYYAQKFIQEQEKKGLIRPSANGHNIIDRFKKRWG